MPDVTDQFAMKTETLYCKIRNVLFPYWPFFFSDDGASKLIDHPDDLDGPTNATNNNSVQNTTSYRPRSARRGLKLLFIIMLLVNIYIFKLSAFSYRSKATITNEDILCRKH